MRTVDFTLNLNVPSALILMTLTWDTSDTDLDTYVIDPTGDYSCYYHEATADGGELDLDVTTGYGPEHWTLLSTDTIRYDEPYRLRVHYFSDNDNGPSNYTVSIRLYEGTGREVTYWHRGNLSISNTDNDSPNAQGADWVDIAFITLTRDAAPAKLSILKGYGQQIAITVPIPSTKERIKMKGVGTE